ncbi:hypothetical protein VNO78_15088 [Psophocarpus tetragonolobus]|uniref:Uncharacterized protein n=1 Tax=Psophocarpus tetragonolobus TaxID=3891 RepID=A0AAN9XIW0_PSOTE
MTAPASEQADLVWSGVILGTSIREDSNNIQKGPEVGKAAAAIHSVKATDMATFADTMQSYPNPDVAANETVTHPFLLYRILGNSHTSKAVIEVPQVTQVRAPQCS